MGTGFRLTKDDVFALLHSNSADTKVLVTQKVCREYLEKVYSPEELKIAEQIFRLLCKDAELMVRASLSEALKLSDDLPHDVAISLANDVEKVALPILEFSSVLTDEDLASIIENKDIQKAVAISRRNKLSRAIIKNLIATSEPSVVEQVLGRKDFAETEENFVDIIEHFADDERAIKEIIKGATFTGIVMEKMLSETASNVVTEIKNKYNIVPKKIESLVSHTVEVSTLAVIDHHSSALEIDYLINHLFSFGRLTPSLILSSLCMGKCRFFIAAIAKRAGIPKENALSIANNGGAKGLAMLLKKAGIPDKLFTAIDLVYRLAEEKMSQDRTINVKDFCKWLIAKLEFFTERHHVEYLNYMLALAKQNQASKAI